MKTKTVAVIGSKGAVGSTLIELLDQPDLLTYGSEDIPQFAGVDIAFFCVSNEVAKDLIPKAREAGTICIDASSVYRHDPTVPLIIPEINEEAIFQHQGIIASPNCTTTIMLLPLAPLHKMFGIRRIIATTFQAVSGAGKKGMEELEMQTKRLAEGKPITPNVFPEPCAYNVFLHESHEAEEEKMRRETQKILGDVKVSARCVRVPVMRSHSIALNVELEQSFSLEEVEKLIQNAPGVQFSHKSPTPLSANGKSAILCGSLRRDMSRDNCLELWVCGDQLLKGAALNMLQIFERL